MASVAAGVRGIGAVDAQGPRAAAFEVSASCRRAAPTTVADARRSRTRRSRPTGSTIANATVAQLAPEMRFGVTVENPDGVGRVVGLHRGDSQRGAELSHRRRRGQAPPDHVSDRDGEPAVVEDHCVVPVAADLHRRVRGAVSSADNRGRAANIEGEQPELKCLGHGALQLAQLETFRRARHESAMPCNSAFVVFSNRRGFGPRQAQRPEHFTRGMPQWQCPRSSPQRVASMSETSWGNARAAGRADHPRTRA